MTIRNERPTSKRAPQQQGAFVAVRDCAGRLAFYYNPYTRQVEMIVKGEKRTFDLASYDQVEVASRSP